MEGIDGYPLKPLFARWAKFKAEIIERFEPKEGAMLAKQEMDSLRYKNDISDYLEKIRSLNYWVKMTGVSLRSLILAAVPAEVRNQLLFAPTYNTDDDWMELVQRIGQTLELAKRQKKPFEVKQVTSKKQRKPPKLGKTHPPGRNGKPKRLPPERPQTPFHDPKTINASRTRKKLNAKHD